MDPQQEMTMGKEHGRDVDGGGLASVRMPAFYIPHGAGPCFFMDWNPADAWHGMAAFLRGISATLPARPRAIALVSGHWLEPRFGVMFPGADIPVVQLSLRADLEPHAHLDAGRALAPLREEGVMLRPAREGTGKRKRA